MKVIVGPRLEEALIKHGLVPPNCRVLDIVIEAHAAASMRYEVFLTEDDLRRFSLAFAEAIEASPGDPL